jgi:hypothetical protein
MRFGERIVVWIVRPIYRTFFERLFWWFLLKVKVFMLADVQAQLAGIEARLRADETQQRWASIEARLRDAETANAAQWDALEQLLLALYRQPEIRSSGAEWETGAKQEPVAKADDRNRLRAANNAS